MNEVVPYSIGCVPELAVSGPLLLQTDNSTFLTFNAMRIAPDGMRHPAGHAVVEIMGCSITKFGYPNDEAQPGHPLYSRGLDAGEGVYEVLRSSWVAELTAQNRVRFPSTPDSTERHFIFTFHESTFECIATDLRVSLRTEPYEQILRELQTRVLAE